MLATCKTKEKNRIFFPFFLQFLDGKTFEQFALALKITLYGGDKKLLAKTARPAQEKILAVRMVYTVDVFRLVDVEVVVSAYLLKCLNAYRI